MVAVGGTISVVDCLFEENTSSNFGGAIALIPSTMSSSSNLTILGGTSFIRNMAGIDADHIYVVGVDSTVSGCKSIGTVFQEPNATIGVVDDNGDPVCMP